MKRTRIERLELRLRIASPRRGREVAAELRRTLLPALHEELRGRGAASGRQHLARVEVPSIRLAGGTSASQTAERVAGATAAAIDDRRRRG